MFEVLYVELEFPMLLEVVDHSPNYSYRNSPNYGISLVLAVVSVRSGLLLLAENSSVVGFGVEVCLLHLRVLF
jgi:hypothetical protein